MKDLSDVLYRNIIRPSSSPWSYPIVFGQNERQYYAILSRLQESEWDKKKKKDAYPIARIDDTFDTLSGAKFFPYVDMANIYWQVELEEEGKGKTAFWTPYGLFKFNVMTFGLTEAPSLFQRLMENVLKRLQFEICLTYLDDVVIFSSTFEEHLERLRCVFDRFWGMDLSLNEASAVSQEQK